MASLNKEKKGKALILLIGVVVFIALAAIYLFLGTWNMPSSNHEEITAQTKSDKLQALYNEAIEESGFVNDTGVIQVIQNCTSCHSSKLITQNRMSKEGWEASIVWMQETQNLWDLGDNHQIIVDYLSKHYKPKDKGRRANLTEIDWYELQ